MRRFFVLGSFALGFLLTGCAFSPSLSENTKDASSSDAPVGASAAGFLEPVPAGAVRVVLMRPKNDNAGVLKVFQGQRFHADLQTGDFTVLTMCPNDTRFSVTSSLNGARNVPVKAPRLFEMTERLQAGQQRFYRVSLQTSGDVGVQPLQQSVNDWAAMNELLRLVGRTQPDCSGAGAVAQVAQTTPVPAKPVEAGSAVSAAQSFDTTLNISSDKVFPFASHTLSAKGREQIRQRLDQFVAESGIKQIDMILVQGHSDPVGTVARKMEISEKRAKAVAMFLTQEIGIPPSSVQSEGKSDAVMIKLNCPSRPVSARDLCNEPNRRVSLLIKGRR
jgi:outer membrane protein OmpA-like peptidoglycan-associated protein